jgi:alpha-L-fucosidase 2
MKSKLPALLLGLLLSCPLSCVFANDLSLWYNKPAANWNEALPLGNGRLGAMVYGDALNETIKLNDNTLYSGEPATVWKVHDITPTYDKVVGLLLEGKYAEANELVQYHWLGRLHENYQPLADWHLTNHTQGEISDYRRELDIANSVFRMSYKQNGLNYTREMFVSHPDQVIVMKMTCDKQAEFDFSLHFTSHHRATTVFGIEENVYKVSGQAPGHGQRRGDAQIRGWKAEGRHPELYFADGSRKYEENVLYGDQINGLGTFYEARLQVLAPGSKIVSEDKVMRVTGGNEIVFILSAATSFNGFDKSPSRQGKDAVKLAEEALSKAAQKSYENLKKDHVRDYKQLFDRVSFEMPYKKELASLPTDERIDRFYDDYDNGMITLLYQYGRYLMISASRPGGQPMNLQGIWNDKVMPSWNCGYTLNINAEMNYWPAEPGNLPECHEPFFQMIKEMAVSGNKTAREMYGRNGWVAHHNTSIWRETHPNDGTPTSSYWPMASAWLSSHLWEHYLYSGDKEFLQNEAYPVIKGAAEFFTDWLVDNGEGYLVTPVSNSPEHNFIYGEYQKAAISMGSTMDMALIRELFTRTIEASEILGVDEDFRNKLSLQLEKLLPYRIGARGQLQEWQQDFRDGEPRHRHVSHLYGLHPGNQINLDETPELFQASMRTLELRGDEATGWSMGLENQSVGSPARRRSCQYNNSQPIQSHRFRQIKTERRRPLCQYARCSSTLSDRR